MGEVTLEMLQKLLLDMQGELRAARAELAALNETVRTLARSQVTMQRDIATLKDRLTILTVAVDEHPPAHI